MTSTSYPTVKKWTDELAGGDIITDVVASRPLFVVDSTHGHVLGSYRIAFSWRARLEGEGHGDDRLPGELVLQAPDAIWNVIDEEQLADWQHHTLDHQLELDVDPRVCQGVGCPKGDRA